MFVFLGFLLIHFGPRSRNLRVGVDHEQAAIVCPNVIYCLYCLRVANPGKTETGPSRRRDGHGTMQNCQAIPGWMEIRVLYSLETLQATIRVK